ncbi:MAG: hypothetical protein KAW47_06695 [Thermoplasmatales archaeon]|nr:hypothetical protein [Thermoplasmatales archaeon]
MSVILLKTILNPSSAEASTFIEKCCRSKPDKTMVLLLGDCIVDYNVGMKSAWITTNVTVNPC